MAICTGPQGPLTGYRVLELCTTIAGPACARLLADFGAEVIKIEPLGGDPVRGIGGQEDGISLYGASILRNKQATAIDIKSAAGRAIALDLAAKSDIVVENFRPGTLERLGLGYDVLSARNPGLILVRISGYGQDGPHAAKGGYGAICEAFAGVRHMTGDADRAPARVALPLTDYFAAVYSAFGAMLALLHREKTGQGQVIDTALYEAAFAMMEVHVPGYDRLGTVPMRQGSRLPGTAPNNLYVTRDGQYVLIGANNDAVYARLVEVMGRADLLTDPRYASIRQRNANADALDAEVAAWAGSVEAADAVGRLEAAGVPVSLINTMEHIFADPHFWAREAILRAPHDRLGAVAVNGVVPKLSRTPGGLHALGHEVGADTEEVLRRVLGLAPARIAELKALGVIPGAGTAGAPRPTGDAPLHGGTGA